MRAGRAGGDHGGIGPLQAERDRHMTRCEIDDASRNEKRRDTARPALLERDRGLGNALDATDAGADHDASGDLIVATLWMPAGVVERLARRAQAIDDEF